MRNGVVGSRLLVCPDVAPSSVQGVGDILCRA